MKEEYKEYYMFLEALRKSGIVNMFGATPFLVNNFDIPEALAREVLANWMENYDDIYEKYYSGKKLFRYYVAYNGCTQEELETQYVIEDTEEARQKLVNEYYGLVIEGSDADNFIHGETNRLETDGGGSWDEPTYGVLVLYTPEEILNEVHQDYTNEVNTINNLFKLFEGDK